ncbi:hypothetical protein K490DRAFT_39803 [Saccharata proteae CBS 121410]|uniref:Sister chromatid separation protein-like protein n=1 Tax=Saccharata proteae CBS 121410 TaxID=1314787 RepID=A0A9P4M176_9PEZI|nr:hypothetical protein K490DRAFT_39803 [Saccharata proteae CBS 121410]
MSAPDPELYYLEPDFDPSSLTVPRLRSILLQHDVNYPSAAKKPDLVALFRQHVAPKRRKILNAQRNTVRSAEGIVDMPSSRENSVATESTEDTEESQDEVAPIRAPSTVRRSSRRTRSSVSADPDLDATPVPKTSKTPRTSSKHARPSETPGYDVEERPSTRRTRPSVTPSVKPEERDDESPFTQDNPFQRSSPQYVEPKSERRRQTLSSELKDRERRRSSRRRTDISQEERHERQDDRVVVPSSKTFSPPKTRKSRAPSYPAEAPAQEFSDDETIAGEEFTPEESMELVRARAMEGKSDILPPRRRVAKKSSNVPKSAAMTALLALLGGAATLWRQEKINVGYCGIEKPTMEINGVKLPEWIEPIRPQCELCPPHAYCYPDLEAQCEKGFVLTHHPLSLNGLIPLAPTCEPDSEKLKKVKQVADRGVETLRKKNADYECGYLDGEGKQTKTPEIYEEELKQTLDSARKARGKSISQEEFDDIFAQAMGDIVSRDEVIIKVEQSNTTTHRLLHSTSLAKLPLSCTVRRSVRLAIAEHFGQLVTVLALIIAVLYARWQFTSSRDMEARAKQLASKVFDRLALQSELHSENPRAYPEPFISMVALRDDILRGEWSTSSRKKLWNRVQSKVEQNLNVRSVVRENRSGDVSKVWEWVGVQQLESGWGSATRKRSPSPVDVNARIGQRDGSPGGQGGGYSRDSSGLREMKAWDEGRPVC